MPELTLESLAARVAELERLIASSKTVIPATRDWRSVVGMFPDDEFNRAWIAETEAIREADRKAARERHEEKSE
jgi:hypothetical protein